MTQMSCKDRSDCITCVHFKEINLGIVFTEDLIGVLGAGYFWAGAGCVVFIIELVNDSNANSLGVGCAGEDGFDSLAALEVSVTCNGDEYCFKWFCLLLLMLMLMLLLLLSFLLFPICG